MRTLAVLLLTGIAYSADVVMTSGGATTREQIWSDGVRVRTQSADGVRGSYTDRAIKTRWIYGSGLACMHVPTDPPSSMSAKTKEEALGAGETIAGHPTKKVRVTTSWVDGVGKPQTDVQVEWRATDLQDLVVQRRAENGKFEMHLEHIVLGVPDAKLLAFPSPPCNAAELASLTAAAPKASGGHRTIRFDQGACELLVPLPIAMSIPSDYAVRAVRPYGCFWGREDDLARVLASKGQLDFESIQHGVFWTRPSDSTEYDPASKHFRSDLGTEQEWAKGYRGIGAKDVVVTSKPVGVFPSTRVTMTTKGQRVYMLYLAVPGTDSPAILINYHPAGSGSAADDAVWKEFVESLQSVR